MKKALINVAFEHIKNANYEKKILKNRLAAMKEARDLDFLCLLVRLSLTWIIS